MKKYLIVPILLALFFSACNQANEEPAKEETETVSEVIDTNGSASVLVKAREISATDIAGTYLLTSGSGGWATLLNVGLDGSFTGNYKYSRQDEVGDGYNGAVYSSTFSGKFTMPDRNPDDSFSMTVKGLKTKDPAQQSYIENSMKYTYTLPIGLQEDSPVTLWLPGTIVSELPEEFMRWAKNEYYFEGDRLPVVGMMIKCGDETYGFMKQDN